MSADNWATCPKCEAENHREKDKALAKAVESYGKVPAEQYERMIAEARKEFSEQIEESLREDYEIGIIETEFEVSYSGYCPKCQFKFSFNHKERIG